MCYCSPHATSKWPVDVDTCTLLRPGQALLSISVSIDRCALDLLQVLTGLHMGGM